MWLFADRQEAGRRLARRLDSYRDAGPIVLALPRGGLPVAAEVAAHLNAALDVIVVRKLGVPYQPELGPGAVGEDGALVLNAEVLRASGLSVRDLSNMETRERAEVERHARALRPGRPMTSLHGRTVIIVDDGSATRGTTLAAIQVARAQGATSVVVAAPVAPAATVRQLRHDADAVIVLETPEPFPGVGQWYRDFTQVSEEQARELLEATPTHIDGAGSTIMRMVDLSVGGAFLPCDLSVPSGARGATSPRRRRE